MEEEVFATRKTSSRRSKPDITALVDQQRFLYTYKPRCPDLNTARLYPTVDLCALPALPTDDLRTSEDESSRDTSPTAFSAPRKRPERRSDAGIKRVKKLPVGLRNGDQARLSSLNHPYNDEDTHCLSSKGTVQHPQFVDDTGSLATTDTETDDDDNLPLSSFIVSKPFLNKTGDRSPSPLRQAAPSHSEQATPPSSPSRKPTRLLSPSPALCYCSKPAVIDDPRWDGEFCSPECLISMCHQAFYASFRPHPMRDKSAIV
ncbi:hypothetical protein CRM22_002692 [Opisthorchis felineus]|uniref:Uncharacterized protein n=1 Tax=Opisthorchis felineus TaxID=147828 RepID=A0A4S2MB67_OPIFE|nr:hypothetical protein CRM22_002692 [Opisthorchis felineus]